MNKPNTIENDQYWKINLDGGRLQYLGKTNNCSGENNFCLEVIKVINNSGTPNIWVGKNILKLKPSWFISDSNEYEYLGMKLPCLQCKKG